jgi:hypothetical protein
MKPLVAGDLVTPKTTLNLCNPYTFCYTCFERHDILLILSIKPLDPIPYCSNEFPCFSITILTKTGICNEYISDVKHFQQRIIFLKRCT